MPGKPQTGTADVSVTITNRAGTNRAAKGKAGEGRLGAALPPGVVRAYGEDKDGAPLFLGEGRTEAVIPPADLTLRLGGEADLPVVREQVSFMRPKNRVSLSGWRIVIRNGKSKPVEVRVEEPVSGAWEITRESVPDTKNKSGLPEWTLTIPANSQAVLEYNVKTEM